MSRIDVPLSGPHRPVVLHVAAVLAASASKQAAAQMAPLQRDGGAAAVLRRAALLAPATALLHLPQLELPGALYLLQGTAPRPSAPKQLDWGSCLGGLADLTKPQSAPCSTPLHGGTTGCAAAGGGGAAAAGAAGGVINAAAPVLHVAEYDGGRPADVIPPTPCSAATRNEPMPLPLSLCLPDSQECDETAATTPLPTAGGGSGGLLAGGGGSSSSGSESACTAGVLLRCCSGSTLSLLPHELAMLPACTLLCSSTVPGTAGGGQQHAGRGGLLQRWVFVVDGIVGGSITAALSPGGSHMHVQLAAESAAGIAVLRQLLAAGVEQASACAAGEDCSVEWCVSPLDASLLADCLAAQDALIQAATLQCAVLEDTLAAAAAAADEDEQQQQQQQENVKPNSVQALQTTEPGSCTRKRSMCPTAALPLGSAASAVLQVDGRVLPPELGACWAALHGCHADAALAIAQLAAHVL